MHSIATKYSYTDCSQTDVFCSSTVEREIVPRTVFDKIKFDENGLPYIEWLDEWKIDDFK